MGAQSIAQALKKNTTLQYLSLSLNQIGEKGVRDIAEALLINTSLLQLNLNDIQIENMGSKFLINMLLMNYSIRDIDTWFNNIGRDYNRQINQLININKNPTDNSYIHKIIRRRIYFNLIL